jgi:signal transduction histidine kinase
MRKSSADAPAPPPFPAPAEELGQFYAHAPVALCTLNGNLEFTRVNEAYAALSGRAPEDHLGRRLAEIHPHLAVELIPRLREVLQTGRTTPRIPLRGAPPGEQGFWLHTYYPIRNGDGAVVGIGGIVQEPGPHMDAAAVLRRNEELTRAVIDSLAAHVAVLDRGGTIIATNAAWDRFARNNGGPPAKTGVGINYLAVCRSAGGEASDGAGAVAAAVAAVLSGERDEFYHEYPCHSLTEQRWFLLRASGLGGASGGAVLLHVDITERKLMEGRLLEHERLRVLTTGLINGQEEERRRLARELHDGLNQEVAVLAIELGMLAQTAEVGSREEIRRLQRKTFELSEQVRRISHRLHPASLEHLGLNAALRSHAAEFSQTHGVQVDLTADAPDREISAAVRLCLYRVFQETLRNAVRHGRASRVTACLRVVNGQVALTIEDDGSGFDIASAGTRAGLGLASMEERVNLVGGCFMIQSAPGAGTRVEARVPMSLDHE